MREAAIARPSIERRWDLIDDVDLTLRRLVEDKLPRPRTPFTVRFDQPVDAWEPSAGLNLNVYLYDVRENLELRDPNPRVERDVDGSFRRRRPPTRINLFYVLTAWSAIAQRNEPQVLEEHRLLADVLRLLLSYPTLPRDVLVGSLVGQEPPLPTLTAQLGEGLPHPPSDFWTSLHSPLRPSLSLIVTVALQPASADPPTRLLPVASEEVTAGPSGGPVYRLSLLPPLAAGLDTGAALNSTSLATSAEGSLAAAVRAADDEIDVVDAGALAANSWLRILDGPGGTRSDYFRVPVQTAPGPATLPLQPPMRFAHASGSAVERLTIDVAQIKLVASAAASTASIVLDERKGLGANDVLMLDDGERTEFVQLTAGAPPSGSGPVPIAEPLRFGHDDGRPVRKVTVAGSATTLAAAANQPTTTLSFAAPAPNLAAGIAVMIDRGDAVEFATLGPSGSPRPLQAPLRRNHASGAQVRAVEDGRAIGRLVHRAQRGGDTVHAVGDALAGLRLHEVIRVGVEYHELVGIGVGPGGLAGTPARLLRIGGQVVDAQDPQRAVVGARVVLAGTDIGATTDDHGRFVLADVPAGSQTLEVAAPSFVDGSKVVQVPSTTFNEYDVRLVPA